MKKVIICGIDTAKLPKINDKQCREYFVRLANGDTSVREELIVCNMRLVLSVMRRFNTAKVSADDMFQAGVIGLIKAIDNFNLAFDVSPSTYIVPMIVGEIKRFIKSGNSLRISRSIRDTAYMALKVRGEMEKAHLTPTIEDIAKKMEVATSDVVYALDAISDTVSLYEPVYSKNGDELLLVDQIGDDKNTEEKWVDNVSLAGAVNGLEEREKKIITLRYFEGKTQTEISNEIGISQAQVSRLEKNALKEIKNMIRV